ncbi:hypothetical protein A2U01_0117279, partial [Trifolium medium]|nr:hypothetical protein [Trifolium medium]
MGIALSADYRVIVSLNAQVKWVSVSSVETLDTRRISARSRLFALT